MSLQTVTRQAGVAMEKTAWRAALDPETTTVAATAGAARLLILCSRYSLPYRVLRCAAQDGTVVFTMGNDDSRSLRFSRYCRGFIETPHSIFGKRCLQLADDINSAVARHGITMVLAAGHLAMRSLVQLQGHINVPCFPMPTPAQFDTLNNKWSFSRHCLAQGVTCPESWLFSGIRELRRWLATGRLPLPLIAKPLDWDGGHGVRLLPATGWEKALDRVEYTPIIVQRWIGGEDIGAAAWCREGNVESFLAHRYQGGVYEAFPDRAIRDSIERILRPLATSGVFNFDMRRDAQGQVHFLECNPRFFFKIALAMEAGLNFVQCGLGRPGGPALANPVTVRRPAASLLRAATAARLDRRDMAHWAHLWADPLPYLRETLRIDWDE